MPQVCAELREHAHAKGLYDRLWPVAHLNADSNTYYWFGSIERPLGLLASLMEHWDLAQQHFEDALTANERWGIRPAIARTRAEYAAMLLRRDRPGDRGKAHDLATIALDEAESMKMLPLAEKTRALLGRQRFPSGLTRREVEVIRLIARGNTNPEIADALVITVNTVRRHVTHILEKTGTANRTEAASFAVREGLSDK